MANCGPHIVHEYAIEWTAPEEIAGTVTLTGTGIGGWDRAGELLKITRRLPGEQDGQVVFRSISYSEFRRA